LGLLAAGAVLAILAMGQSTPPAIAANQDAAAAIEGTALGGDGLPLAGASLTLARKTPEHEGDKVRDFSATSDAFGRFAFAGLVAGRYAVSASHDGYEYYQGAPVDISSGQRMAGVTIRMSPLAVLSGKVTDEDGKPMPDVTVSPMQRDMVLNGRVLLAAAGGTGMKTGADGLYRLMLEPGRWYLSFRPSHLTAPRLARPVGSSPAAKPNDEPEHGYVTTYYPGVPDSALALGLVVAAGQQMPS